MRRRGYSRDAALQAVSDSTQSRSQSVRDRPPRRARARGGGIAVLRLARHKRSLGKHAEEGHEIGVLGGLAALSLDALSSVAYGPEAMILVLVAAGSGALSNTVPLTLVIGGMLVLLVVSYTQVIAAHPEGGGAYAVAKGNLGRWPSLLAAAAVVVDYVLTVAVSLAAGAASIGSVFPSLAHHLVLVSLVGLAILTVVNMFGLSESAKLLMLPTAIFEVSIFAMILVGAFRSHPVAHIGTGLGPIQPTTALGLILLLKAFAAGCSAVTGVEAISNGVPAFRRPRVATAQRTEVSLGVVLGVMLVGLALLIRAHHVVPRGGVTILAQVSAGAFGTGWPFYVSNIAVAVVLGLAANTSFGGLPVLMSLLAKDHRLPHLFYLRAERPVYRYGILTLALIAALLLVAVGAQTPKLIPLFTIGVFVGFTISQVGLVRHWYMERPHRWRLRAITQRRGRGDDRRRGGRLPLHEVPRGRLGRHARDPAAHNAVRPHRELLRPSGARARAWQDALCTEQAREPRPDPHDDREPVDRARGERRALAGGQRDGDRRRA